MEYVWNQREWEIIERDGHLIWDKNYGREGIEEGEGDITEWYETDGRHGCPQASNNVDKSSILVYTSHRNSTAVDALVGFIQPFCNLFYQVANVS